MIDNDTTTHKRCEPPGSDIREFPCGCIVEMMRDTVGSLPFGMTFLNRCATRNPTYGDHARPPVKDEDDVQEWLIDEFDQLAVMAEDLRRAGLHDAAVNRHGNCAYIDEVVALRITADVVLYFDFNLDGHLRYRGLDPR